MEIILYIALLIASVGITWIAMYGTIFNRVRQWVVTRSNFFKELLACALCTGFWSGVVLVLPVALVFFMFIFNAAIISHVILALVIYTFPFQTAAVAYVCELLVDYLVTHKQLVETSTKTQQLAYYDKVLVVMDKYSKCLPTTL